MRRASSVERLADRKDAVPKRYPLHAIRYALCLVVLTGCVRRQLTIRSEPPGARVLLNDELIGTTPLTYDFEWYGWQRITLAKDGYERLDDHVNLKAPAHLWIPLDLAMELWPMTIRDDRVFSYHLAPLTPFPEPAPPTISTTEE